MKGKSKPPGRRSARSRMGGPWLLVGDASKRGMIAFVMPGVQSRRFQRGRTCLYVLVRRPANAALRRFSKPIRLVSSLFVTSIVVDARCRSAADVVGRPTREVAVMRAWHSRTMCILVVFLFGYFGQSVIGEDAPAEAQKPTKARDSITIAELRDHLFFLASDHLASRHPGKRGFRIAAEYAASQMRGAGLNMICTDGQGAESFLQPVAMLRHNYGPGNSLLLKTQDGQQTLEHGDSYILFHPGMIGASVPAGSPVFVGYGISEPEHSWDDLAGLSVKGKTVLMMYGTPRNQEGEAVLPQPLQEQYEDRTQGLRKKVRRLMQRGVAAIIVVPDQRVSQYWMYLADFPEQMRILPAELFSETGQALPAVPMLFVHPYVVFTLFEGRGYSPRTGEGDYRTYEMSDLRIELRVDATSEEFVTHNVVGLVRGTDDKLKDEYVVVGAHLDRMDSFFGTPRPGADDNASGCAAVIETAEALAMDPPRRSVVFVLYTATELGQIGSTHFIERCPVPVDDIIAYVDLDEFGGIKDQSPPGFFAIGASRICPDLEGLLNRVNDSSVKTDLDFMAEQTAPTLFYSGDQYQFHRKDIASVGLRGQRDLTARPSPTDDASMVDFAKLHTAALLTWDLLIDLANADTAPCSEAAG